MLLGGEMLNRWLAALLYACVSAGECQAWQCLDVKVHSSVEIGILADNIRSDSFVKQKAAVV